MLTTPCGCGARCVTLNLPCDASCYHASTVDDVEHIWFEHGYVRVELPVHSGGRASMLASKAPGCIEPFRSLP